MFLRLITSEKKPNYSIKNQRSIIKKKHKNSYLKLSIFAVFRIFIKNFKKNF